MINRILTVLLLVLTTITSAYAIDYSGKTVTIWIPFKTGGGTDAWARAIGPAFSKNLPGNPKVIVQNVTEGGILGASVPDTAGQDHARQTFRSGHDAPHRFWQQPWCQRCPYQGDGRCPAA